MTTECAVRAGPVNVRSSRFPALTPEQMRTLPLPPPRPRKIKPGRPNFKIGQENRRVTEDASRAGSARQRGREALWASEEGCIPLCPRDHNDLKALRRDGFAEEVIKAWFVARRVFQLWDKGKRMRPPSRPTLSSTPTTWDAVEPTTLASSAGDVLDLVPNDGVRTLKDHGPLPTPLKPSPPDLSPSDGMIETVTTLLTYHPPALSSSDDVKAEPDLKTEPCPPALSPPVIETEAVGFLRALPTQSEDVVTPVPSGSAAVESSARPDDEKPALEQALTGTAPSSRSVPSVHEPQTGATSAEGRPRPARLPKELASSDETFLTERLSIKTPVVRGELQTPFRHGWFSLSHKCLDRLAGNNSPPRWLNDEAINFYLSLIEQRAAEREGLLVEGPREGWERGRPGARRYWRSVFFHSTDFWSCLRKNGGWRYREDKMWRWAIRRDRRGRWDRHPEVRVDLFKKDLIFIPVNIDGSHWIAAAVDFRDKRIGVYDSFGGGSKGRAIAREVFRILRKYLDAEWRYHNDNATFDFDGWENYSDPGATPQQENGYDCGVFACQVFESLSCGEGGGGGLWRFAQEDMTYLRRLMALEMVSQPPTLWPRC